MPPFTFIHAADLHLDAALPAPPGLEGAALVDLLSGAPFTALRRLVDLAIASQAAFVIIAGDVFHSGAGSFKANLQFAEACKKLGEHGIELFWARGNHDSISQSRNLAIWPENVHVFSAEGERFMAAGGLAELYGVSHKLKHEKNSLAPKIKGGGAAFSIGVLHCAVNGLRGAHAAYAPCNLSDLTGDAKAYWALGHVHNRALLAEEPLVLYPGSLQGLHINEGGAHGCYVVTVDARGRASASFAPLAPVRWEKLTLDASGAEHLEDILSLAAESAADLAERLAAEDAGLELLVLRLELVGHTPLDRPLRSKKTLEDLQEALGAALTALDGRTPLAVRLKDVVLATAPDIDLAALEKSDSLVGEVLRRAGATAARLDEFAAAGGSGLDELALALAEEPGWAELAEALGELFAEKRLVEAEAAPAPAELAAMAREAAALCLHLFSEEKK